MAVRLGDILYSVVQNRILKLYRECGIERPAQVKSGVCLYCKGSKRKGVKLVQDLSLEVTEGKKLMILQV